MSKKQNSSHEPASLLAVADVIKRVGLKRTTIYNRVRDGSFPAPRKLGNHPSAPIRWNSRDIDRWIESLPRAGEKAFGAAKT